MIQTCVLLWLDSSNIILDVMTNQFYVQRHEVLLGKLVFCYQIRRERTNTKERIIESFEKGGDRQRRTTRTEDDGKGPSFPARPFPILAHDFHCLLKFLWLNCSSFGNDIFVLPGYCCVKALKIKLMLFSHLFITFCACIYSFTIFLFHYRLRLLPRQNDCACASF